MQHVLLWLSDGRRAISFFIAEKGEYLVQLIGRHFSEYGMVARIAIDEARRIIIYLHF